MDASGGSQIEVDGRNYNDDPHWSPSGRKIVYAHRLRDSQFPENDWEIATANANGSRKRYLTDNLHQDFSPAWSPDGTKIAFVSDRDGDYDIYVMNADGTGPRTQLTDDPADDDSPEWSPGSKRIAFTSARVEGSSGDVYRMRADGSHQTRLTKNPAGDADPTWSPDGTKIAFTSFRNPDLGDKPRISIYVMDAARESETNVPQWLAKGYDPDWQPLP
jgi:Tol biopolymer transport system component